MLIKAGSTLLVPRGNSLLADVSSHVADTATLSLSPDAPPLRKVSLRAGRKDTVASVARRYKVKPAQVAEWNRTSPGASFAAGQTIVVYVAQTTRHAPKTRNAHGPRSPPRVASHGTKARTARAAKGRAGKHADVARD
jgi:membrane-bound lytic murein transglycosylase D